MFAASHQEKTAINEHLGSLSSQANAQQSKLSWEYLELKGHDPYEPFGPFSVAMGKYLIILAPDHVIIDTEKRICYELKISESPLQSCERLIASHWKDNKIVIVGSEARAPDRSVLHFGILTIAVPSEGSQPDENEEDDGEIEEEYEDDEDELYDLKPIQAEYEEIPVDMELDLKSLTAHLQDHHFYLIAGFHYRKGLFSGDAKKLFCLNLETQELVHGFSHDCSLDHISYLHENKIHVHFKGPLSDEQINEEIIVPVDKYQSINQENTINTEPEIRQNSELFPFNNPLFQYQVANGKIYGFIHNSVEESNYQTLHIYDMKTKAWAKYEITGEIPQLEVQAYQMSGSIIVIENEIYAFTGLQKETWRLSLNH